MTSAADKLDRGQTMAEMWDGYAEVAVPFDSADGPFYQASKRAFYSGALVLFNWFMVQMDEDREPTEADLDRVSTLEAEIAEYFASQKAGEPGQ